MENITRRSLLRRSAATAAGVALLAADPVKARTIQPGDELPGELVHPAGCLHRKFAATFDVAAEVALEKQLYALLDDHGQFLLRELSDVYTDRMIAEEDSFVDELARHLPGLAPMVYLAAEHVTAESRDEVGVCCSVADEFYAGRNL